MKSQYTVLVPPTSHSRLDSEPIFTIPHPKCKWWVVYKMWAFSIYRMEFDAELTGLVEGGEVNLQVDVSKRSDSGTTATSDLSWVLMD
jgi:hypothetical protein